MRGLPAGSAGWKPAAAPADLGGEKSAPARRNAGSRPGEGKKMAAPAPAPVIKSYACSARQTKVACPRNLPENTARVILKVGTASRRGRATGPLSATRGARTAAPERN